jgi:hypothetical protein
MDRSHPRSLLLASADPRSNDLIGFTLVGESGWEWTAVNGCEWLTEMSSNGGMCLGVRVLLSSMRAEINGQPKRVGGRDVERHAARRPQHP